MGPAEVAALREALLQAFRRLFRQVVRQDAPPDLERLGARLSTASFFDGSTVGLNVLSSRLNEGLELMAEVALRPDFPEEEFERVRRNYLGRHRQDLARASSVCTGPGAAPTASTSNDQANRTVCEHPTTLTT